MASRERERAASSRRPQPPSARAGNAPGQSGASPLLHCRILNGKPPNPGSVLSGNQQHLNCPWQMVENQSLQTSRCAWKSVSAFFPRRGAPAQQGLGLGLFISSEIARVHGGSLEATSDEIETRFTFRMAIKPPALKAERRRLSFAQSFIPSMLLRPARRSFSPLCDDLAIVAAWAGKLCGRRNLRSDTALGLRDFPPTQRKNNGQER